MTNRDYDKPLEFDLAIGKQKPNTVRRHEKYCPFCDVPHLKGILDKKGPMICLSRFKKYGPDLNHRNRQRRRRVYPLHA